ncbi:MAG: hypothetical protein H7174_12345 [Flavobacterium sp.]|nr:hypothetical protein [Flavobacterium sp.]
MKIFTSPNLGADNLSCLNYKNVKANSKFSKQNFLLFSRNFVFVFILMLSLFGFVQHGKDGAVSITKANTVLNRYSSLAANLIVGGNTLFVSNISELNPHAIGKLLVGYVTNTSVFADNNVPAGEAIKIYQVHGAVIDNTNIANYGAVTSNNGEGHYKIAKVANVAVNVITLLRGVENAYFNTRYSQIIHTPQYTILTVDAAASITPVPWGNVSFGGAVI